MKKLFYLILCCCTFTAYGNNRTFTKLAEVNKCWTEQTDISLNALPAYRNLSETEWIRTHLMLVEATLRNRDVKQLSPLQRQNRLQCLNNLHEYWQTGNFPVNDEYAFRTPIFIDKYNNFCAVGYLVKASGNEHISRMIAANTNLAYVRQMNYAELNQWAADNGFTTGELAWIQPGYPPSAVGMPVGNGVNGVVNELYVDEATGRMYVGGNFSQIDGAIPTDNIAYVTQAASGGAYTWHKMGYGLPGTVNAIVKFEGKIFAAGEFAMPGLGFSSSAVAYWDGASWIAVGCLNGTVRDLAVYSGVLYACGEFDDCGGLFAPQYFAKWDGSAWHSIDGPIGRVNTMEVLGANLVLGGAFSYMGSPVNIVKWTAGGSFQPYTNNINNEVMDMTVLGDTLHAACKRTHATDTNTLLLKLCDDVWAKVPVGESGFMPPSLQSFNTLYAEAGGLNIGGQFNFSVGMTYASNSYNTNSYGNWLVVDSTVNKMETFNGRLIVAGMFKNGSSGGWGGFIPLNGIAAREAEGVAVPAIPSGNATATIFPNPADAGTAISIANGFDASQYALHHITGRLVASGEVGNAKTVSLPQVAAGIYFVTLTNAAGEKSVQKLQIK